MTHIFDHTGVFFTHLKSVAASHKFEEFTVIFDNDFAIVLDGVETSTPAATAKTEDVTALGIEHGSLITINDADYIVTGIRHDGTGITTLILRSDE